MLELPAKINVLKLEEAAEVLKIMIKRDHTKRGLKGKRILYKNPSWEPSFWTPDWPWTEFPGFKNLRRTDYKGLGVPLDKLKECIRNGLKNENIKEQDILSLV